VTVATLRAALWAQRALFLARRSLRNSGLEGVVVPEPPRLPAAAGRGVEAVLRRKPNTCLERAFVLQRWQASQGDPREVVIGVRGKSATFQAHAWLDGDPSDGSFEELLRVPAR